MGESVKLERPTLPWGKLTVLLGLALVALFAHVALGSDFRNPLMTWRQVWHNIFWPEGDNGGYIWDLRLPRAFNCVVVGAILGMVGSAFQSLFRNPLAEPYIVGVSSGGAVGGAIALIAGFGSVWVGFFEGLGPMMAAFPVGLLSLLLVFALSRRRGVLDVQTLLLAGVVVGSMLSALLSLVLLAGGKDTRVVLQWLLGSMTPAYTNRTVFMAVLLAVGAIILIANSRKLNAFALGESTAQRLGVDVRKLKAVVLVTGTAMAAITVGAVGIVPFLGLVAPHIARRVVGVDWRWSLIGAGFLGSGLLLVSDILASNAVPSAEIPVGVVTAITGAPFLLFLLRRE